MTDWLATLGTAALMYAVHSTLTLGLVALLTWRGVKLPADRERLWKWGVLLPFVTVPLSLTLPHSPLSVTELEAQNTTEVPINGFEERLSIAVDTPSQFAPPVDSVLTTDGEISPVESSVPDADWSITISPATGPADAAVPEFDQLPLLSRPVDPVPITVAGNVGLNSAPQPIASQPAVDLQAILTACGAVALLCLGIGLLRIVREIVLLHHSLRHTQVVTAGPVYHQLQSLRQQQGVRNAIAIHLSCGCLEPAACGIWRWRILIPEELTETLPRDQMHALLAHELGHLVRRDTLWLWIGRGLACCLPWQPLNWLAIHCWRVAEEFLADAWALDHGVQPLTLARCLTDVADWRMHGPICPGVPATAMQLSHRVAFLTSASPRLQPATYKPRILLFAATFVMCWLMPRPLLYSSPAPTNDSPVMISESPDDLLSSAPTADVSASEELISSSDQMALIAVEQDLQRALKLLAEQEDDPEIVALISTLRDRCAALRTRLYPEFDREVTP